MRLQFAEPITLDARSGHVEFVAYGRSFPLDLEDNERLLKAMPTARKAELAGTQLLRGKLAGIAGSWVRLARVGDGVEGAIWDGHDLYAITTRARIDSILTTPLAAGPQQTVVYRLSDAIGGLGREFCAVGPARAASLPGGSPLEKYRSMVSELRAQASAMAVNDQIEVSLIGDSAFQAQFGSNATAEMLARLNIVDGIFSGQVGILILVSDLRLLSAGNDPFTTNESSQLLDQLANYRDTTPAVRARGLAHLITGRDLNANVNGIAYIGTVCDQRLGVSLSDTTWATLTAAQVIAHELGHNFGAEHDGVAGSACASTPQNYLMSPTVNGSGTFSACSLATMAPVIAAARGNCVVPASYADASVETPAGTTIADDGTNFVLPFTVSSGGNLAAQNVTFSATLPTGLAFQSGTVPGGTCSAAGANDVACTIGAIPSGEQRLVSLTLSGTLTGNYPVNARISATNDYLHGNDAASAAVTIRSAVDVGVSMTSSAATVYVTDTVDLTIDITAYRSRVAQGATLDLSLAGMDLDSISAGPNNCTITLGAAFRCTLVNLAPGAHTTVVAHARARNAGDWQQSAFVTVSGDGDNANNFATVEVRNQDERGVAASQTSTDFSAVIGQSYENTYTLTALGRLQTTNARFEIDALRNGVIESVTPSAGTCSAGGTFPDTQFQCSFGTLSPGDVRTVVVRFRMNAEGVETLEGSVIYWSGTQNIYNFLQAGIHSAPGEDVAVDAGLPAAATEGVTGVGNISVSARGINPSLNVVVTLDLPAPMELTDISLAGWTCTRPTARQGRCSIATLSGGTAYIGFRFTSPEPGQFQAHIAATSARDGVAANDTKDLVIDVLTYLDVATTSAATDEILLLGTPKDLSVVVSTGARAVTAARITAINAQGWEVVSMSAGAASCQAESFGYSCSLGDLTANARIPVTVRYNALRSGSSGGSPVCTNIARDSNPQNNCVNFNLNAYGMTDLRLQVDQASVSGSNGTSFHLPMISVVNGTDFAARVHVRVPIPGFATVQSVSSSAASCTGTTLLDCDFQLVLPNRSETLDITLAPNATGTFTSNLELLSVNDSTSGNNAVAVSVAVGPAIDPSPGGGGSSNGGGGPIGGGGGGGGRFEWLALAFLALLAAQRVPGRGGARHPRH